MGAKNKLRLHYRDGKTVTRTIEQVAHLNGTDVPGARALIAQWVTAGDLEERPDGGYDVINFRPPKVSRRKTNGRQPVAVGGTAQDVVAASRAHR